MTAAAAEPRLLLVTGLSGAGKSTALKVLEDLGWEVVDNLPLALLDALIEAPAKRSEANRPIAVGIDSRSRGFRPALLVKQIKELRENGGRDVQTLFLDCAGAELERRFSETRRRHPLSGGRQDDGRLALVQVIELERELLAELREQAQVIDTSNLRGSQLQAYIKDLIGTDKGGLSLVFQSFAFKHGVPVDADYVFDVRMLPNPHYENDLRDLTGLDAPVADFLKQQPEVDVMEQHIAVFLEHWLPAMARNHRSYVTVAIGCTGGQHRSVYLVERLAARFASQWPTLRRHRELDGR